MKTFVTGPSYARRLVDKATTAGVEYPHQHHGHRMGRRTIPRRDRRAAASAPMPPTSFWPPAHGNARQVQPQKRPRSSWKRFQAEMPNQLWQADVTTGGWPITPRWIA
jgi:hypothetical protein